MERSGLWGAGLLRKSEGTVQGRVSGRNAGHFPCKNKFKSEVVSVVGEAAGHRCVWGGAEGKGSRLGRAQGQDSA